ncbi:MAG: hypothetical protein AB8B72_04100 [Crocinitomicaceae bacterium]
MNHRNPKDKDLAILWARTTLKDKNNFVILDTETSGLGKMMLFFKLELLI